MFIMFMAMLIVHVLFRHMS